MNCLLSNLKEPEDRAFIHGWSGRSEEELPKICFLSPEFCSNRRNGLTAPTLPGASLSPGHTTSKWWGRAPTQPSGAADSGPSATSLFCLHIPRKMDSQAAMRNPSSYLPSIHQMSHFHKWQPLKFCTTPQPKTAAGDWQKADYCFP